MRRLLSTVVCTSVLVAYAPVGAAMGSARATPALPAPVADEEALAQGHAAWIDGRWSDVRAVLEPVAQDQTRLQDPRVREEALCKLADATINDTSLDEDGRRLQAGAYLKRLLDADPSWRLPSAIYSPELFEEFLRVQDQHSKALSAQCEADRMACSADLADTRAELEDLRMRYDDLERSYEDQTIQIYNRVARSRVFAAIPFGVGHFYNGGQRIKGRVSVNRILGGVFLGTEAAVGLAGLTLILYRVIDDGCRREEGFQRGSLQCSSQDLSGILRRRKAEEALGWVFWGTLAIDIALAQYRFRPFQTLRVDSVPRRDLDDGEETGRKRRRRQRERRPRAKVRPTGGGGPSGASLGVSVRF